MSVLSFLAIPARWVAEGSSASQPAPSGTGGLARTGTDGFHVLLVDDEELIRRLAASMATRLQVDLVAVATAPAALEFARASRIEVLVADVLLGEGTDGIELARQIVALQPLLSVVLMSGYDAAHFDLTGLPEQTQFLTKPFSTESFMHCLAAARERAATSGP